MPGWMSQPVAFWDFQLSVADCPLVTVAGDTVSAAVGAAGGGGGGSTLGAGGGGAGAGGGATGFTTGLVPPKPK